MTLEHLGLHMLAVPLCHVVQLLAGAMLHSPALASASQLRLAALAEALVLPALAARAEKQAGPFQLSAADASQHQQVHRVHINACPQASMHEKGSWNGVMARGQEYVVDAKLNA